MNIDEALLEQKSDQRCRNNVESVFPPSFLLLCHKHRKKACCSSTCFCLSCKSTAGPDFDLKLHNFPADRCGDASVLSSEELPNQGAAQHESQAPWGC